DQVYAQHAERLLLACRVLVEQLDVDDDLGAFPMRGGLEPDSEPTVPVLASRIAARGHRIGEDEEGGPAAASRADLLDEPGALAVEHRLEARPADLALGGAAQRGARRHGGRRTGRCRGAGGTARVVQHRGDSW